MPIYDYHCMTCGHTDIEYKKMDNAVPVDNCPKCGQLSYAKQVSLPATDLREFHDPIEMYSIAMDTDEEIKEFQKKAPDVEVSTDQDDPMYGIPIARNRKQKLAALKTVGYTELN